MLKTIVPERDNISYNHARNTSIPPDKLLATMESTFFLRLFEYKPSVISMSAVIGKVDVRVLATSENRLGNKVSLFSGPLGRLNLLVSLSGDRD